MPYTLKQIEYLLGNEPFKECGNITIKNNRFTPTVTTPGLRGAGVYLWVARKGNSYEILYVGKAKDGPESRLSQHKSGINGNTNKARKRREKICQCIKNRGSDGQLLLYFRESNTETFTFGNGNVKVSRYSLDEEALILHLLPILNRSKPPIVGNTNGLIEAISGEFEYSNAVHFDAWKRCIQKLSEGRLEALEGALKKVERLAGRNNWGALDMAVVGSYAPLPHSGMDNRPVLVFGRYVNKKFSNNGKFALLALDEGDDKDASEPDILFFRNDDRVADCCSYERFVQRGVGLSDAAREKLDAITEVINQHSERCLR